MACFRGFAGLAAVLIGGSLASGAAQAQVYGPNYQQGGYTFRQDSNYCIEVWTQRGWMRHRCMNRAEIAQIQNVQRQLQAQIAQLQAQRQQQEIDAARARGQNLIMRRNPNGGTDLTIIPPGAENYIGSPRASPNSEWFQGPPQYRR